MASRADRLLAPFANPMGTKDFNLARLGKGARTFTVPGDMWAPLYEALYADHLGGFRNLYVEHKTPHFPLFLDLDGEAPPDTSMRRLLLDDALPLLASSVAHAFSLQLVLVNVSSARDEMRGELLKTGLHVHFRMGDARPVLVSTATALVCRDHILEQLERHLPGHDWGKIVDPSVLKRNGLRMLWQEKNTTSSRVYEPLSQYRWDAQGGLRRSLDYHAEPLGGVDALRLFSVRAADAEDAPAPTPLIPDLAAILAPSSKRRRATAAGGGGGGGAGTGERAGPARVAEDVPHDIVDACHRLLKTHEHLFPGACVTAVKWGASTPGPASLTVGISSRMCHISGREHKSNHVFLRVSADGESSRLAPRPLAPRPPVVLNPPHTAEPGLLPR